MWKPTWKRISPHGNKSTAAASQQHETNQTDKKETLAD